MLTQPNKKNIEKLLHYIKNSIFNEPNGWWSSFSDPWLIALLGLALLKIFGFL